MLYLPHAGLIAAGGGAAAAAPVFDSFALALSDNGNVSSKTATISWVAGDLLIGMSSYRDPGGLTLQGVSGWTSLLGGQFAHSSNANYKMLVQYLRAVSGGSNPVFQLSSTSDEWGCAVGKITGSNATPIDGTPPSPTFQNDANNDPQCPGFTTGVNNCLILRIVFGDEPLATQDAGYPSAHTGTFARAVLGAENAQIIALAHKTQVTAGAAGTAVFTNLTNNVVICAGITIAIKP